MLWGIDDYSCYNLVVLTFCHCRKPLDFQKLLLVLNDNYENFYLGTCYMNVRTIYRYW